MGGNDNNVMDLRGETGLRGEELAEPDRKERGGLIMPLRLGVLGRGASAGPAMMGTVVTTGSSFSLDRLSVNT